MVKGRFIDMDERDYKAMNEELNQPIDGKYDHSKDGSHYIQFGIHLNDKLGIQSATIDANTTDLPSNSELIKKVAIGLLKSLHLNKEDVMLQDLLNELDIKRES